MKSLGAIDTTFAAAHPVLCRGKDNVRAVARIRRTESLRRLVVANTLPLSREARRCKTIQRVSIAPLVAAVAMSCELGLSFDEESIYASLAQA
jgi:phosphoribosylpyrophosphate synthetase